MRGFAEAIHDDSGNVEEMTDSPVCLGVRVESGGGVRPV